MLDAHKLRIQKRHQPKNKRVKLFESAQMDSTNAKPTKQRIQRELSAMCVVVCFVERQSEITIYIVTNLLPCGLLPLPGYIFAHVYLFILLFRHFLSLAICDFLVR